MAQAAAFDALIVLRGVVAGDGRFFQRDAEMFLYEVAGGEDGQEGIPLAALTVLPKPIVARHRAPASILFFEFITLDPFSFLFPYSCK